MKRWYSHRWVEKAAARLTRIHGSPEAALAALQPALVRQSRALLAGHPSVRPVRVLDRREAPAAEGGPVMSNTLVNAIRDLVLARRIANSEASS